MPLHRIVFYAQNNLRDSGTSMKDLARGILESCTRHEAASGLTGALVFNERVFVQVMEGKRALVSDKMWRLAEDKRMASMVILGSGDVPYRRFATWSVGYAGRSVELDRLYLRYGVERSLDPEHMNADQALGLIDDFIHLDTGQLIKHAEPIERRAFARAG